MNDLPLLTSIDLAGMKDAIEGDGIADGSFGLVELQIVEYLRLGVLEDETSRFYTRFDAASNCDWFVLGAGGGFLGVG